ncbi:P1 family peptidase [Janibacter sp. GXQ6167]|uniref:P1 family peptidase n=1 Tax=Janibacter sp. GXQ6167 TaxID=3240791 RepID=UPI0035240FCC
MRSGTHNAITDVDGVRVGHATRDEPGWLTGVSVIVPPVGTVGGVAVRGGGPGTRETDLLDPRHRVDALDAVVLSGGSAFGLGTADGVMAALAAEGRGWPVGEPGQVVPIVPTAIVFDLGRAGTWLHHPGPSDGRAAYDAATAGPVDEGGVGAGTGAQSGGLKGGVGSASAVLDDGTTVGAYVVVNAVGSTMLPDGSLRGAHALLPDELALPTPRPHAVSAYWEEVAARRAAMEQAMTEQTSDQGAGEGLTPGTATTIGVVATDATLTKAECATLAGIAHDGLARAISPVHTSFDGDTFFALATGARPAPSPFGLLDLQVAAADCVTRAIVRAMIAATSVDRSADGGIAMPSYRDALT